MTVIQTKLIVLAGIPEPIIRANVASILLDLLLPFGVRVHQGPHATKETGLVPLNEFMVQRPNFVARGRKNVEVMFSWADKQHPGIPSLGSLTTFINAQAASSQSLLDALISVVQKLDAPTAYLDHLGFETFRDRQNHHRSVFQDQKGQGEDKRFGIFRGLSGIAWRNVLGPDLVRFFGQEALESLDSSLAEKIDDEVWVLTPCSLPEEWSSRAYCEGEREIIKTLGCDKFFDPDTGVLPTHFPDIRSISPLPVKLRTPAAKTIDGPFEAYNGYIEP